MLAMKADSRSLNAQPFGKRKSAPLNPAANPVRKPVPPSLAAITIPRAPAPAPGNEVAKNKDSDTRRATAEATESAPAIAITGERADLVTFFGPHSDKYLKVYDRLNAKPGSLSFNWPAFSLAFVWFFYRKLYLIGAVFMIVPLVMAYVLPFGAGLSGGVFAWFANRAYIGEAKRRIKEANELGLTAEERSDYLRRKGGVSLTAAIGAGLLYAGMGALAFLQ